MRYLCGRSKDLHNQLLIAMQTTVLAYNFKSKQRDFYHQSDFVMHAYEHIYPETMQQRMFGALFGEMFMWKLFRQFVLTTLTAGHIRTFNLLKIGDKNLRRSVINATIICNVLLLLPRSVRNTRKSRVVVATSERV